MNKVTGRFFAPCRNVKRRSRHPVCRVSFYVFVWSLARRSNRRSCQPEATRPQEGQAVKRKNGFLSNRGGLRIQEKTPHEATAKVSSLRPGSVHEPAPQEQHTPIHSRCGSKNTGSCSDLSAAAAEFSGLVFTAAIADGRAHAPHGIVLTEAKVKETGS